MKEPWTIRRHSDPKGPGIMTRLRLVQQDFPSANWGGEVRTILQSRATESFGATRGPEPQATPHISRRWSHAD